MKDSASGFYWLVVAGCFFIELLATGCATQPPMQLYTGPQRAISEVGRVLINEEWDVTIDDLTIKKEKPGFFQGQRNDSSYYPRLVELLPGPHEITATFSRFSESSLSRLEIRPIGKMTRHLTFNIDAGREYFFYFDGILTYRGDRSGSRSELHEDFFFSNVELKCHECGPISTDGIYELAGRAFSMKGSINDEVCNNLIKAMKKGPSKNNPIEASGKFMGGWSPPAQIEVWRY